MAFLKQAIQILDAEFNKILTKGVFKKLDLDGNAHVL